MNMQQSPVSGIVEPCLVGKLVRINDGRAVGRVIARSDQFPHQYLVQAFQERTDVKMFLNARDLELITLPSQPAFKSSYARAKHGIVCILDGGPSGYWVTYTQHDKEFFCRPEDLTPWVPLVGELVCDVEYDDESANKVSGVVLESGDGTSLVKWPRHAEPQIWDNANLEPVWTN